MMAQMKKTQPSGGRFGFVSDFVGRVVNESDSAPGELLKWSLHVDLQRVINQEYELAISSLCHSVRETQSSAAFLLLAEAYAQVGEVEMAVVTIDVLRCVDPNLPEAEMMKGFLLREKGDHAEARRCFQATVRARPFLGVAWKELIDMALEQGDHHEAARLLSEAIQHNTENRHLLEIQGSLSEVGLAR